jgi:hypothetical protein
MTPERLAHINLWISGVSLIVSLVAAAGSGYATLTTIDAQRKSLRAYVRFDLPQSSRPVVITPANYAQIDFQIINAGQSIAYNVKMTSWVATDNGGPTQPYVLDGRDILPGDGRRYAQSTNYMLTPRQIKQVKTGDLSIIHKGKIEYIDVDNIKHATVFCYERKGTSSDLVECS